MKRLLSILFVLVIVCSLIVVPSSADDIDFSQYGIFGTYSSMSGSYNATDYTLEKQKSIVELSGVNDPSGTYDISVTFTMRLYLKDHQYSYELKNYFLYVLMPSLNQKTLSYDDAESYFTLGNKDAQNGFTYDYITFDYMGINEDETSWDSTRIAFLNTPYGNDLIFKTPANWGEFISIRFTILFENIMPNIPTIYDTKPGEANARNDDIVAIDLNHYIYPTVYFTGLRGYLWDQIGYAPASQIMNCYLTMNNARVLPRSAVYVRALSDRQTFPTSVFVSNFLAPIHNRVYYQDDQRYFYRMSFSSTTELTMGSNSNAQTDGWLNGGLTQYSTTQPFYSFRSYESKVDTVYYYTAIQTNDYANYQVNDSYFGFYHCLDDPDGFTIYYRTKCIPFSGGALSDGFSSYPLSFGGWILYKPVTGVFDFIANGDGVTEEDYFEGLYVNIAPQGDNAIEKIANVFTQTIPNIFNNAIIWFMCESPLLSNITRPIYISAVRTGDIVKTTVIPILASLNIVGIVYGTIFIIMILRRLLFK